MTKGYSMKKGQKQALAIGAGAAALAAAAAGVYFLTGKRGAKNRKKVAVWADKAKKEVVSELKGLQKVSKQTYNKAVDEVTKRYKQVKNIDPADVMMMANELKGNWDAIAREISNATKKVTKSLPKKKVAKKKSTKKRR